MNNNNGQGAIEYLLIIGAAIIVVAIVIIFITGMVSTAPNSNEQVKSGYQGILDIYDKATNTATVILKLKGGSNTTVEFQSFKTANTINDLFSSLPEGTEIILSTCNDGLPITKISTGWNPTNQADCEVPIGVEVTITLPPTSQDQDLEVKTEIEQKPIYLISDGATLLSAIETDPNAHYKLAENITFEQNETIPNFSGTLDGDGKTLSISTAPIINEINNSEIKNLTISGSVNMTLNQYLIETCENSNLTSINISSSIRKNNNPCTTSLVCLIPESDCNIYSQPN